MLTVEELKKHLPDLTDDQYKAIETLSRNDEDEVIGDKIREIYDRLDDDIRLASGIDKEAGEKTYNYAKRAIKTLSEAGADDDAKKKIEALQAKNKELAEQLKKGEGNEALTQQLQDARDQVEALKATHSQQLAEKEKALTELQAEMGQTMIGLELDSAAKGLKYMDESIIPAATRKMMVDAAKKSLLAEYQADFTEVDGEKVRVFRDADGKIMRNPDNHNNPMTAQELMATRLAPILDQPKPKPGGGTQPPKPGTGGGGFFVKGRTQIEADEEIGEHIVKKGIPRGTPEFDSEFVKLREESGVAELPFQ